MATTTSEDRAARGLPAAARPWLPGETCRTPGKDEVRDPADDVPDPCQGALGVAHDLLRIGDRFGQPPHRIAEQTRGNDGQQDDT